MTSRPLHHHHSSPAKRDSTHPQIFASQKNMNEERGAHDSNSAFSLHAPKTHPSSLPPSLHAIFPSPNTSRSYYSPFPNPFPQRLPITTHLIVSPSPLPITKTPQKATSPNRLDCDFFPIIAGKGVVRRGLG